MNGQWPKPQKRWGKRSMNRKPTLCMALFLALMLVCPVSVRARVSAATDNFAQAGAVYVAGNPDCYPIEYYDAGRKCYSGVLPRLLEDISEASGVDFVYINAGAQDRRAEMAENRQAELISGCLLGKDRFASGVKTGDALFAVTLDGKTYDVAFAYTEIASQALRTLIEDYAAGLPAGEMARRVATFAAEQGRQAVPLWVWLVMAGICAALAAIAIWAAVAMRRRSRRSEAAQQLDPGTGAWNRRRFAEQFALSVSDGIRPLCYLIYLRFDLGRVNEYYGKDEAEELLRYTKDVIERRTEQPDFFARVSGGGFAVLGQHTAQEQAEAWTRAMLDELNEYGEKFGRDYAPEYHAGIYALRSHATCETALYAAEQGCRYAEREGLPCVLCDEQMLRASREQEKLRRDVIRAVEDRAFYCYLQPILHADTQTVYGAELLSRWHHPELGVLMPEKFIGDMEQNGTISELDLYMFEEACRLLAQLARDNAPQLTLFCNISRKTVSWRGFFDRISLIAQRYSFDRSRLCMEITESSMFEKEEYARENIRQCRQAGFLIALDDVGGGHSSFGDLAHYPIEVAKIDRALLSAAAGNGRMLLRGINALFHSLQIKTLCEGVETPQQLQIIREMGIDLVQGFCVQRPLPVAEALQWMNDWNEKKKDLLQ